MTSPIGDRASAARMSIEAALRRHADAIARAQDGGAPSVAKAPTETGFANSLSDSLQKVDAGVKDADRLVDEVIAGRAGDFHEVALRLKQSELSFRFAMEVRNKLVDAYREVMRMSV